MLFLMKTTRMGLTTKTLTKVHGTDGTGFVMFRALPSGLVRVFTYCTWSDYTTKFELTRSEARVEWTRLTGEGWAEESGPRAWCRGIPFAVECAA